MISKEVDFAGNDRNNNAFGNDAKNNNTQKPQQQYEQNTAQAAPKGTDKKAAAKGYIKDYIKESSVQEALQTYQKVWHQVYASSKQGVWSAVKNSFENLKNSFTGGTDVKPVNEGDILAIMRKDPGEAVKIARAGSVLSDLLDAAKSAGFSWKDITDMVYEVSNGKMDIKGSKEGLISSMKNDTSTNLEKKDMENTVFRGKGEMQYSSMNPKLAISSVDMKSLANDIVTYNNKANELTKMLESLEQSTNVSAANLLRGVKTPGGLYVNNQGNRVNFNEDQNKRINQLLGDIQTLKTEQEAIAKIVDEIPEGSQTDYEFVKAYRAAVANDQLVDRGAIIPKLDEILLHHPSQQDGGELYTKARANAGYD